MNEKLRKLRGKIPRKKVAGDLEISLSAYTKYERGERIPKDSIKKKIANYYGVTVQSIFFD